MEAAEFKAVKLLVLEVLEAEEMEQIQIPPHQAERQILEVEAAVVVTLALTVVMAAQAVQELSS